MDRPKTRRDLLLELEEMKRKPCMDCISDGRTGIWPIECMQFDHRNPDEKICKVGVLAMRGDEQGFYDEIAKCDLVCANCHAIRTKKRGFTKRQLGNMKAAKNTVETVRKKSESQSKFMTEFHRQRREAGISWLKGPREISPGETTRRSEGSKRMWKHRARREIDSSAVQRYTDGESISQLCKDFRVCRKSLEGYLRHNGIVIRSRSEAVALANKRKSKIK